LDTINIPTTFYKESIKDKDIGERNYLITISIIRYTNYHEAVG